MVARTVAGGKKRSAEQAHTGPGIVVVVGKPGLAGRREWVGTLELAGKLEPVEQHHRCL